jgi:hypothetical protein
MQAECESPRQDSDQAVIACENRDNSGPFASTSCGEVAFASSMLVKCDGDHRNHRPRSFPNSQPDSGHVRRNDIIVNPVSVTVGVRDKVIQNTKVTADRGRCARDAL